jgi:hypothetical protein
MADEHGPACWIEIGFDKRKRLADSQTGSPEHDDESAQSIARSAGAGSTHHRDDLLNTGRVRWVAAPLIARRVAGEVAGQGRWRARPADRIEQNGTVHGSSDLAPPEPSQRASSVRSGLSEPD